MSVLDDLDALDFTAVVDVRTLVTGALSSPAMQSFLDEGAAGTLLSELGPVLSKVENGFSEPEALVAPLISAIGDLAGTIRIDAGAVSQLVAAVGDGARIIATVVEGLSGDLNVLEIAGDRNIGTALNNVSGGLGDFALRSARSLGRQRVILDTVERGLPHDPAALLEFGLDVVLPFPKDALRQIRAQVDTSLEGLASLELTSTRADGILGALEQVRVSAEAGDAPGLSAALDGLARVRADTVRHIGEDIRRVGSALERLSLGNTLQAVAGAGDSLNVPGLGVIEDLADWRQRLADARIGMARFDASQAIEGTREILDLFESEAHAKINGAFDDAIAQLQQWLRGLLRELPLRQIRGELSAGIDAAAKAISDAGLDSVAREIRGGLDDLAGALESVDLGAMVEAAVAELANLVAQALDAVEAALSVITDRINALAIEATAILGQVETGLRTFREAVDEVQALIDNASLEAAAQSVIDTLANLRETASDLLSVAPLPDELRPVVEQLTAQVEAINLDEAIGKPLADAAKLLQVPEDVGTTVQEGLDRVAETLANLIPGNVAADLQAELDGLFDQLTAIDLSSLTAGISGQLEAVAQPLEELDIESMVAPASEAFATAVSAFDQLQPHRLLAPAIDAYDSLLGQLPVPDPATVSSRAGQVVSTAGEAATVAMSAPLQAAAGSSSAGGSEGSSAGSQPRSENPVLPEGIRPGDIIRLVGFIPAQLREALQALEGSGAGQVLADLQNLCGGLAGDLRRLQAELVRLDDRIEEQLDALLRRVADAQVDAQLALSANATLFAREGLDVNLSVDLVASGSAESLKRELAGDLAAFGQRTVTVAQGTSGGAAQQINRVADTLEACALSSFGDDLEAFLDALDPEPIAAEFDALIAAAFELAAGALPNLEEMIPEVEIRVRRMLQRYNPGAQAQRLLVVLQVLREELDLLNPRRLADELAEIHAAIRAALTANDPAVFARELDELVATAVAALRGLDPSALVPDLSPVQAQIDRVPGLLPLEALSGVSAELEELGAKLNALDVPGMIETVNTIAPTVTEAVQQVVKSIQAEIVALLDSIKFASTHASASVSVGVSV